MNVIVHEVTMRKYRNCMYVGEMPLACVGGSHDLHTFDSHERGVFAAISWLGLERPHPFMYEKICDFDDPCQLL